MDIPTDKVWCLGTGKNYKFFQKINEKKSFFDQIIPLEHPRYIVQYKHKHKQDYIDKYLRLLTPPAILGF